MRGFAITWKWAQVHMCSDHNVQIVIISYFAHCSVAWIGYPSRVFLEFRSLADVVWFEFRFLSRIAQDERESASGS